MLGTKFSKITEMPMELTALDYESLIKFALHTALKAKVAEIPVALFLESLIEEYKNLSKNAAQALLLFCIDMLVQIRFFSIQ